MAKVTGYTQVRRADLALPISSNALRVLLYLRLECFAGKDKPPKARELTYADLREALPIGKDAIGTAVRELVDGGLVKATPRPGNRWRYAVAEPASDDAKGESAARPSADPADVAPLGRARRKGQRFRVRQPLEPTDGERKHEPGEPVDGNRVSRLAEPGEPVGRTASADRMNRVSRSREPGEPASHSEPRSGSSLRSPGSKQADVAQERDACLLATDLDPSTPKDEDDLYIANTELPDTIDAAPPEWGIPDFTDADAPEHASIIDLSEVKAHRTGKATACHGDERSDRAAPDGRPAGDGDPAEALAIANAQRAEKGMPALVDSATDRDANAESVQILKSMPDDPRPPTVGGLSWYAFVGHCLAGLAAAQSGSTHDPSLRKGHNATPLALVSMLRNNNDKRRKVLADARTSALTGVEPARKRSTSISAAIGGIASWAARR